MIFTFFVGWIIIGFVCAFFINELDGNSEITVEDIVKTFWFGLLGPTLLLMILFGAIICLYDSYKHKVIYRK